jgi:hypothetical protein
MGIFQFEWQGCNILISGPEPLVEVLKAQNNVKVQVKLTHEHGYIVWENLNTNEAHNLSHLLKISWFPQP